MEELATKTGFKKYESYKVSGLNWVEKIPSHWEVERSKWFFEQRKEKANTGDIQLTASQKHGLISQKKFMELEGRKVTQVVYNTEILKKVRKGDFVISMRSFQGGLEYSEQNGAMSSAYVALKPSQDIVPEFFKYLFKSDSYVKALSSTSNLVRDGQAMRYDNFCQVSLYNVPLAEQEAIASFLDEKTAKIDKAIAQKEKLIELLKERKQIIIQNAVTKGLNPDVKMKDSGVEWIGEIPEHWEVKKAKHFGRIRSGDGISNNELKDSGLYEVYGGNGLMGYSDKFNVDGDKIIIGRVGALCGNVRLIRDNKFISDNALIYSPTSNADIEFLERILIASNLNDLNTSSAQPLITGTKVVNHPFPYPPKEERKEILKFIHNIDGKIHKSLGLQIIQIEKLKEYKAALIDCAVTGKIRLV